MKIKLSTVPPVRDIAAYWNQYDTSKDGDPDYASIWKQRVKLLDDLSAHNKSILLAWSTDTPDRFAYVADKSKLTGYDTGLFTAENGVAFSFSKIHPQYLHASYLMNEMSVNYIIAKKITPADGMIVAVNYLYKRIDGTYIHLIQRITLLEADASGRIFSLAFISEISHIKKPGTCNLTFFVSGEIEMYRYNFDSKCMDEVKPFSDQEVKVLQLLGQGLTTKDIADKLYISRHTVDTHRRNLIKKTDCIDTTAVVTYARMVGLL